MTYEQILAFGIIAIMMAAFLWEKFRYDVIACCALVAAVAVGLVPAGEAFSGFSDDLVIIVGSALVVSAGVARSGVVDLAIKRFFPALTSLHGQMLLLLVTVTVLSAFIKNIGALAIMMPVAFQFARRSNVPPSVFLMPMAFSALLGGLMTQIGTSPNIAVSRLREELTGQSFTMFDFTPVGATLAAAGIVFLIFFYWLVPRRENQNPSLQEALESSSFATEAMITRQSPFAGKTLHHLLQTAHGEVTASAILRGHTRLSPFPDVLLHEEDTLLLEGPSEALDRIVSQGNLSLSGSTERDRKKRGDISSVEAVIGRGSPLIGQTTSELSLVHTYGVNLLAVSRQGKRIRERLGQLTLRSGDVVLLQGLRQQMPSILTELGCLPLAEREILLGTSRNIFIPLAILVVAMGATALGLAPVAIAFFAAALAMVAFGVIPVSEVYRAVDGPILVMLAALIPVADTLRTSGGSDVIAGWLNAAAGGMPVWGAVAMILLTAMAVTPFLNNAATVLVMAPIAASFATGLGYKPEAFLMAVAIGAGCDFLTPIGHQCNTLVMGPGGYRFSDYPRLGLPLSILIVLVSVPTLLMVWPVS
ncbi:MAG: SLC13 family permease [Alphaproteobacteria bacterium]|jgi:di/tricarboxylate transporter|uniref:SLC13 family permease n=1 Tax=Rhizobium/Agrobacterium group TaxID=227290 RepID=UPI0006B9F032|nr:MULTISPECIES: SLC13 family permease [Rhizobium/Agrobacterium group]MBU0738046.1 SLC13 family permease [Alphaproteobacteria bacterium]MDM7981917.1 SLC13 family permease [Rhizobium sp.]AOG11529.1 citrate transporter family protein [Agrobacterium sp. RAC06]KPF60002.1 permease [Rhizobium sp. AAP116]MBU0834000.1 SLC13 family permease [Alphaproteobacteria bacterium]